MIPGDEAVIRQLLRYLRSAQHDIDLAVKIGGFLVKDLTGCQSSIKVMVERTEDELERLRRTN